MISTNDQKTTDDDFRDNISLDPVPPASDMEKISSGEEVLAGDLLTEVPTFRKKTKGKVSKALGKERFRKHLKNPKREHLGHYPYQFRKFTQADETDDLEDEQEDSLNNPSLLLETPLLQQYIQRESISASQDVSSLTADFKKTTDPLVRMTIAEQLPLANLLKLVFLYCSDNTNKQITKRALFYEQLIKKETPAQYNDGDKEITAHSILVGFRRDIMRAIMLGSDEMFIYKTAQRLLNRDNKSGPSKHLTYPLQSSDSYIALRDAYHAAQSQLHVAKEASPEQTEQRALLLAAKWVAKASEYFPRPENPGSGYNPSCEEAISWARLGERVQYLLKSLRSRTHDNKLNNIKRFIGKSGDNPQALAKQRVDEAVELLETQKVTRLEKLAKGLEDPIAIINKEILALVQKDKEKLQTAQQKIRQRIERELTQINRYISAQREVLGATTEEEFVINLKAKQLAITARYERDKCLAQKAIDLHYLMTKQPEAEDNHWPWINWINDAPVGLIKWTHRALQKGVPPQEAFAVALCRYTFGADAEISRAMVEKASQLKHAQFHNVPKLLQIHQERGLEVNNYDVLTLATENVDGYEKTLEAGYTPKDIIAYPWLTSTYLSQSPKTKFPTTGHEGEKAAWCAKNAYYFPNGWQYKRIGNVILSRLEKGIENNIHDATYWLKEFEVPEDKNGIKYKDREQEMRILRVAMNVPQCSKGLPKNPNVYERLFSSPELSLLYEIILNTDREKFPEITEDYLLSKAEQLTKAAQDQQEQHEKIKAQMELEKAELLANGDLDKSERKTQIAALQTKYRPLLTNSLRSTPPFHSLKEPCVGLDKRLQHLADSRELILSKEDRKAIDDTAKAIFEHGTSFSAYKPALMGRASELKSKDEMIAYLNDYWSGIGPSFAWVDVGAVYRQAYQESGLSDATPGIGLDEKRILPKLKLAILQAYQSGKTGRDKQSLDKELAIFRKDPRMIVELINDLKDAGERRKAFTDDSQMWVAAHGSSPKQLLTRAWGNRTAALSEGVADNPRAIIQWADLNALRVVFDQMEVEHRLPANITRADLQEYAEYMHELIRCYDAEKVIKTISKLKQRINLEQHIPSKLIDLGDGWTGEIIPKADPRGFTIGYDTGCCMTIGGVSKSCIWAGYRRPDCGFFVLYRNGQIVAQSFIWVNEKVAPNILVCDNIEANEGRDMEKVISKYDQFFHEYIKSQQKQRADFPINTINIGTENVTLSLGGLQTANPVSPPTTFYTDAEHQKLLFELKKPNKDDKSPSGFIKDLPLE